MKYKYKEEEYRDLHKDVHNDVGDWKSASKLTMPGFPKKLGGKQKTCR